jgi:hypothetical protein
MASDKNRFVFLFHPFLLAAVSSPRLNQNNMPGVSFTDAQVEILSGVIEKYQKITGKDKATKKTNFITELTKKVAPPEELKDSKAMENFELVSIPRIVHPVPESEDNQKSIKNWLLTHGREAKNKSEFFKSIGWYSVFVDKKGEEIKVAAGKLTDGLPGSAEYLAAHRKAATDLAKGLKDDERESYKKIAEKWNNQGAPQKVQEK